MNRNEFTAPAENGGLRGSSSKPTNEYVLNIAFYSFVGFMAFQAVFALIANSEAMLADSEAMSVDALTYLFNMWAERIKKEPLSGDAPLVLQIYRQEMRRLCLELIPPAISVVTLIVVTIFTLSSSLPTIRGDENGEESEDVDVPIMLFFSGLNLLLDVVNVTCFARAESAFGLDVVRRGSVTLSENITHTLRQRLSPSPSLVDSTNVDESSSLLPRDNNLELEAIGDDPTKTTSVAMSRDQPHDLVNLNMCSAWTVSVSCRAVPRVCLMIDCVGVNRCVSLTNNVFFPPFLYSFIQHICADTFRSIAVFVAAGIAVAVPSIAPAMADAVAAVAVSVIILVSILPLLHGLVLTALKIYTLSRNPPSL
jgi:Co/Zn/Cd efflux system component